jgi:hypothetical protein
MPRNWPSARAAIGAHSATKQRLGLGLAQGRLSSFQPPFSVSENK